MGYVGNEPSVNFTSFAKQDITGNGGANYTLTHAVANANEIEVYVNNVRQEPTSAYSVSGTALTMTGNVASSDDFYVIFLGKALQTTVPPDSSVTNAKIANSTIDLTSKVTGVLPVANSQTNTPAFKATLSSNQTISNDTLTRVTFDVESYDTDNAFASNIFTVPSGQGGTYAFSYLLFVDDIDDTDFCLSYIEVDGVQTLGTQDQRYGSSATQNQTLQSSGVLTLTAGQTVEVVVKHGEGANQELRNSHTYFQMYKLIGI